MEDSSMSNRASASQLQDGSKAEPITDDSSTSGITELRKGTKNNCYSQREKREGVTAAALQKPTLVQKEGQGCSRHQS